MAFWKIEKVKYSLQDQQKVPQALGPCDVLFWQTDSPPLSVAYNIHKHQQY